MTKSTKWYYKTLTIFRYSNLRIKFIAKSRSSGFGPVSSYTVASGNSYEEYDYSSYLIFGYEEYNPEKKQNERLGDVAFSCTTIADLCEAFRLFVLLLQKYDVFEEVDDPNHGYHMFVKEEYRDVEEKVVNESEGSITIRFAVSENKKTQVFEPGVNIFFSRVEGAVFLPIRILKAVEHILRKLDFAGMALQTALLPERKWNRAGGSSSAARKVAEEEV